jgi:hypothetical protein
MMIEDKDKKKKAINNINNNGQTDIKAYFFWISLIIFMCISGIFYVIKNIICELLCFLRIKQIEDHESRENIGKKGKEKLGKNKKQKEK